MGRSERRSRPPTRLGEAVEGLIEGLAPHRSGTSFVAPDLPLDGPVALAIRDVAQRLGRPVSVIEAHERAVRRRGEADALAAAVPQTAAQHHPPA